MSEAHDPDPRSLLRDADQAQKRTRQAARWWPRYVLVLGFLASVLLVLVEVVFPDGWPRIGAIVLWLAGVTVLGWWAETRDVHPRRSRRGLLVAIAIWFGVYLVAIGPLVRWKAGDSLAWWSLAAVVLAIPFVVVAVREWTRR